ncbi:hypothetical protein ABRP77_07800 [Pectobacterium odoriferum]|uniref:transcriptional antitermination N peptide n=1 Tax=Pectobacterium odoriferum TaxID=78398 RepID=UPI0032ECD6A8
MTTIIVKPAKDNAKTRRYRQRGELMARRREHAALAFKISKAWAKLTHVDRPFVKAAEPEYSGSVCLQNVALFNAGHRSVRKNVTHIIK